MKAYILSGGKSSRMGTDKGLMLLHQKPLISYLIETLQKLDFEVKIIAHHPDYQKFNLEIIKDIHPEKGPLGGIFTALNDARADCLIISVDTPFIAKKQITHLIKNHQKKQLTLAFSEAKMYPLFGVYPFHLLEKLKENIQQNQLKLMKFVEENGFQKIEFCFSSLEKLNINTLEELKTAEKLLKYGN